MNFESIEEHLISSLICKQAQSLFSEERNKHDKTNKTQESREGHQPQANSIGISTQNILMF